MVRQRMSNRAWGEKRQVSGAKEKLGLKQKQYLAENLTGTKRGSHF
jgi:hypothetical protein